MAIRTPQELYDAWEAATKDNPMVVRHGEEDNFIKAMRLSCSESNQLKITIQDRDILLKDGVPSPITKKPYFNRADWNNHLKEHGCVEIGNDYNNAHEKKRELKGNYNVRAALAAATREVLTKQGYR